MVKQYKLTYSNIRVSNSAETEKMTPTDVLNDRNLNPTPLNRPLDTKTDDLIEETRFSLNSSKNLEVEKILEILKSHPKRGFEVKSFEEVED